MLFRVLKVLISSNAEYLDSLECSEQSNLTRKERVKIIHQFAKADYEERVKVTSHVQDISDLQDTSIFSGMTSVFHLASIISVNNFPDYELMERVNNQGTSQVLKACLKEDVGHLVYASTVDVVCGYQDIVDGTEEGTKIPDTLIFDAYGRSELKAERMVLSYNGKPLNSGIDIQR